MPTLLIILVTALGHTTRKISLGVCYAPILNPHFYIGSPESSY